MDVDLPSSIQAKLKSDTGEEAGGTLDIPLTVTKEQLQLICNALLEDVSILMGTKSLPYPLYFFLPILRFL